MMRKKDLVMLLLAACLFLGMTDRGYCDLLTNGGFELGSAPSSNTPQQFGTAIIDGWSTWGASGYAENDFNHTSGGAWSIKTWSNDTGIFQDFTASGGLSYNIGGFAYSASTDALTGWNGLLKVEWYNSSSTLVGSSDVGRYFGGVDPTSTWNSISGTFEAPALATTGRVVMYLEDNGGATKSGSLGWDDVSVTLAQVPELSSATLLGLGLVAIAGRLRRRTS